MAEVETLKCATEFAVSRGRWYGLLFDMYCLRQDELLAKLTSLKMQAATLEAAKLDLTRGLVECK